MGCDDYPLIRVWENSTINGRYRIVGDAVAELWNPALAKRFPNTSHHHCFQAMKITEGQQYPVPFDPPRCQDWHCPRCGQPVTLYGHHTKPCTEPGETP